MIWVMSHRLASLFAILRQIELGRNSESVFCVTTAAKPAWTASFRALADRPWSGSSTPPRFLSRRAGITQYSLGRAAHPGFRLNKNLNVVRPLAAQHSLLT